MRPDKIQIGHVYIGWDGAFRRVTNITDRVRWRRERLPDENGPHGGKRSGFCSLSRFGGWADKEHPDKHLTIERFQLGHIYKFKFSGYVVQLVKREIEGGKTYWTWVAVSDCNMAGGRVTEKYLWEKATYHLGIWEAAQ